MRINPVNSVTEMRLIIVEGPFEELTADSDARCQTGWKSSITGRENCLGWFKEQKEGFVAGT